MRPKLLVLGASSMNGGSGPENLFKATQDGRLDADIVGFVSTNALGGVYKRAGQLRVPFYALDKPKTARDYQVMAQIFKPDFVALSGWGLPVRGLDPRTTFNIHNGPLPRFGGKGMHGINTHAAVLDAYRDGTCDFSQVTMHFVTDYDADENYDTGPIFFQGDVEIRDDDTPETLEARFKAKEHEWQPGVTNLVVQGTISWDGKDADSLIGYHRI